MFAADSFFYRLSLNVVVTVFKSLRDKYLFYGHCFMQLRTWAL